MIRVFLLAFLMGQLHQSAGQYQWKQQKDKDGIKVYVSDVAGSNFKAVKVECTFTGTYVKLFSILTDVAHLSDWVYNAKSSYLLKQVNPLDIIYFVETHLPWPLSNRDAVIHLRIRTDSMPKFFTITGTGEPNFIPEKSGKVRVPHYAASWKVAMPTQKSIQINYVVEVDPGGSIPAWISNMFVDKGLYESFKKLAELLSK